jgi:hypothetical protein
MVEGISMTKKDMIEALADMPDNTELEIHIEGENGGMADFCLEPIGRVMGDVNPPWFTFRAGEFVSDCG